MTNEQISKKVMKSVMDYERRKTLHWFEMVIIAGLITFVCELWLLSELLEEMKRRSTFDVIGNISSETWEILKYELPWIKFHKTLLFLLVLILMIVYVSLRLGIRKRRWKQIKQFEKQKN